MGGYWFLGSSIPLTCKSTSRDSVTPPPQAWIVPHYDAIHGLNFQLKKLGWWCGLRDPSGICLVTRHSLRNLSFGSRAFRISAPKIWNSLPPHILQSQTLSSFRRHLSKWFTFSQPTLPPYHPSPMCPNSLLRLWRYINHLLAYLHHQHVRRTDRRTDVRYYYGYRVLHSIYFIFFLFFALSFDKWSCVLVTSRCFGIYVFCNWHL